MKKQIPRYSNATMMLDMPHDVYFYIMGETNERILLNISIIRSLISKNLYKKYIYENL